MIYDRYFDQTFQFGKVIDEQFYLEFYDLTEFVSLEPQLRFGDLSKSLSFTPSPKDKIKVSISHIHNGTRYVKLSEFAEAPLVDRVKYTNTGASLSYVRNWFDHLTTNFSIAHSNYKHDYQYDGDTDRLGFQTRGYQYNEVDQQNIKFSGTYAKDKWELSAGVERLHLKYTTRDGGQSAGTFYDYYSDADTAFENSIYLQFLLKPFSWGQLESGLRKSKYSLATEGLLEPRFHLSLLPAQGCTLHAH